MRGEVQSDRCLPVTLEAAGSSPVAPTMFFDVEHSRVKARHRASVARTDIDFRFQSKCSISTISSEARPSTLSFQPENLEILVNHLKCAAFEGKRHFHFLITNHLLFIT